MNKCELICGYLVWIVVLMALQGFEDFLQVEPVGSTKHQLGQHGKPAKQPFFLLRIYHNTVHKQFSITTKRKHLLNDQHFHNKGQPTHNL